MAKYSFVLSKRAWCSSYQTNLSSSFNLSKGPNEQVWPIVLEIKCHKKLIFPNNHYNSFLVLIGLALIIALTLFLSIFLYKCPTCYWCSSCQSRYSSIGVELLRFLKFIQMPNLPFFFMTENMLDNHVIYPVVLINLAFNNLSISTLTLLMISRSTY